MFYSYSEMGLGQTWKSQLLLQKVIYVDGGSFCKCFTNGKTSVFDDSISKSSKTCPCKDRKTTSVSVKLIVN